MIEAPSAVETPFTSMHLLLLTARNLKYWPAVLKVVLTPPVTSVGASPASHPQTATSTSNHARAKRLATKHLPPTRRLAKIMEFCQVPSSERVGRDVSRKCAFASAQACKLMPSVRVRQRLGDRQLEM